MDIFISEGYNIGDPRERLYFLCEGEEKEMTKQEASERYCIPIGLLDEYESWGLCREVKKVMGSWQYDDSDLDRLSLIMTLHDAGFTGGEIEIYMRLFMDGDRTKEQRMQMLKQRRDRALDEIHFKEAQLERLDYLRHNIKSVKPERGAQR